MTSLTGLQTGRRVRVCANRRRRQQTSCRFLAFSSPVFDNEQLVRRSEMRWLPAWARAPARARTRLLLTASRIAVAVALAQPTQIVFIQQPLEHNDNKRGVDTSARARADFMLRGGGHELRRRRQWRRRAPLDAAQHARALVSALCLSARSVRAHQNLPRCV